MSQLIKHPGAGGPFGVPAEQALVAASALDEGRESFSLRSYLDILRRRRWFLLATPVIVAALVALNLTAVTPLYRSTAQLQIEPELRLSQLSALTAPRGGGEQYLKTELTKLASPTLARRVIEQLDLTRNEGFTQPIRQGLFKEGLRVGLDRLKRLLRGKLVPGPAPARSRAAGRRRNRRRWRSGPPVSSPAPSCRPSRDRAASAARAIGSTRGCES